jgi:N-formylglutamate deformylase
LNEMYTLSRGSAPLIISIPHLGTQIPEALKSSYTAVAMSVADTDWHLDRLYDFAHEMGATVIGACLSRYVIDLNRPSDNTSLYPGQVTTGLCPTETFRGEPLYQPGRAPDHAAREGRVAAYWQPYHDALSAELHRLRAAHPQVLLWEAHSIASVLPRLFESKLPDLNLGTLDGRTVAPEVQAAAIAACANSSYTWVANGRFKGGYITRAFGAPAQGIHAMQLEMCQSTYMNEAAPFDLVPALAERVKPILKAMVASSLDAVKRL